MIDNICICILVVSSFEGFPRGVDSNPAMLKFLNYIQKNKGNSGLLHYFANRITLVILLIILVDLMNRLISPNPNMAKNEVFVKL